MPQNWRPRSWLIRAVAHLIIVFIATAAHAQSQSAQPHRPLLPSLIPMRTDEAFQSWRPIAEAMGISLPDPATPSGKLKFYKGGTYYVLEPTPKIRFGFDALTGDTDVDNDTDVKFMQVKDAITESKRWFSEDQLTAMLHDTEEKVYPAPGLLNQTDLRLKIRLQPNTNGIDPQTGKEVDLVGDANTAYGVFDQITPEGTKTLNQCIVTVLRDKKQLASVHYHYRPSMISPKPAYSREEALALARWLVAAGQKMPTPLKLSYLFDAGQRKYLGVYDYREPRPVMEEDEWLHQRLLWKFQFEFTHVTLDANTGLATETYFPAPTQLNDEAKKLFGLPQTIDIPHPAKMPKQPTEVEFASVNFNGEDIIPVANLYYPPIIRDNSPLIFSEYFPNFLIKIETKDNQILLEGQLKEKHKAVLKLGEKQYTLDGTAAAFTTPPVKIDDRLYLPAELLHQINGILVRWEPKKKLLVVDTRYMRRD